MNCGRLSMQDLPNVFPRITLPLTPVNKGISRAESLLLYGFRRRVRLSVKAHFLLGFFDFFRFERLRERFREHF